MSGCANRRWGVSCNTGGSGSGRPAANPEMDAALAKMRAERDRQDAALWGTAAGAGSQPESVKEPQPLIEKAAAKNGRM